MATTQPYATPPLPRLTAGPAFPAPRSPNNFDLEYLLDVAAAGQHDGGALDTTHVEALCRLIEAQDLELQARNETVRQAAVSIQQLESELAHAKSLIDAELVNSDLARKVADCALRQLAAERARADRVEEVLEAESGQLETANRTIASLRSQLEPVETRAILTAERQERARAETVRGFRLARGTGEMQTGLDHFDFSDETRIHEWSDLGELAPPRTFTPSRVPTKREIAPTSASIAAGYGDTVLMTGGGR